jgi:hypothetical protein
LHAFVNFFTTKAKAKGSAEKMGLKLHYLRSEFCKNSFLGNLEWLKDDYEGEFTDKQYYFLSISGLLTGLIISIPLVQWLHTLLP